MEIACNFCVPIDYVVSSPCLRTLRTAEIIAKRMGLEVNVNQSWGELNRGIYTKRPYQEFIEEWAKHEYSYNYIPPSGESINQGRKRIVEGIEDILAVRGDVLCVTHAGMISNLLMMLYGFGFEEGKPKTGQVCELEFNGNKVILKPEKNRFLCKYKKKAVSKERLYDFK